MLKIIRLQTNSFTLSNVLGGSIGLHSSSNSNSSSNSGGNSSGNTNNSNSNSNNNSNSNANSKPIWEMVEEMNTDVQFSVIDTSQSNGLSNANPLASLIQLSNLFSHPPNTTIGNTET